MKENVSKKIDLHDINPQIFAAVIDFVQSGKLQISKNNYLDLFKMAEFFCFDEMQKACTDWMSTHISEDTIQDVVSLAHDKPSDHLKQACDSWVCEHIQDFANLEDLYVLATRYQLTATTQKLTHVLLVKSFGQGLP